NSIGEGTSGLTNNMKTKYIVDLCLEPGVKIGNCLLLYFKFGPSYVGWRQTRKITETVSVQTLAEEKQDYHNWGYTFGTGANALITRCISAFAEFESHFYPNNSKQRIDFIDTEGIPRVLEFRTRLYGFGFRFGLSTQF
ncbi:MAG: hypothetical protein WAM28_04280, partial [Chlamydiales bacterium]